MQNDEVRQIGRVVTRLAKCHPELPSETVAVVVRRVHQRFGGASVRDFVPLLVESRASRELAEIPRRDPSTDHADRAQAGMFFELLVAEAEELDSFIKAMARTGANPVQHATELRRLRTELHEVLRCIAQLRRRFPGIAAGGSSSAREIAPDVAVAT